MADTFVWYELMTTDVDAAEAFYREVLGWSAKDAGQPDMRYLILSAGEHMAAGLMAIPAGCEGGPGWSGYIGVDDVDAVTARVAAAGGTVHRAPDDIPEVGRYSVVTDPQGAPFMLFTPVSEDPAPPPAGTPGHVGWHELCAADWPAAFEFYAALFGWTRDEAVDMGPMGTYQMFAAGGPAIGGMMNKPQEMPSPAWQYYFTVDEADAAADRVATNGGRILNGPMEVPGGYWILNCLDPQGAIFALVAPRR